MNRTIDEDFHYVFFPSSSSYSSLYFAQIPQIPVLCTAWNVQLLVFEFFSQAEPFTECLLLHFCSLLEVTG
jgi:hypothetical protein